MASDGLPGVALFERNRALAVRIGRVLRAGCDLESIHVSNDADAFAANVHADTRVIACDAADLDLAIATAQAAPHAKLLVWSHAPTLALVARGMHDTRISNVIGWPSFESMPRAWELLFALRRLLGSSAPSLRELLPWGASQHRFRPRTTRELNETVDAIRELAGDSGAPQRTAQRLADAAHELLMNAMYDAPVDQYGEQRFAFQREQSIALEPGAIPTLRLGSDGTRLALEVSDPFGRLDRNALLSGIARGAAPGATLDTGGGGAGLGLARIFGTGFALFVDVVAGRSTTLTVLVDLDVRVREARTLPLSLHWFGS